MNQLILFFHISGHSPSLIHHVPVILTPIAVPVTIKPNNFEYLKSTTTTTKSPPTNHLPKVPKNLKVFIPIFKPVWTLHKIIEKLFQDFKNGKIEEYLKVYPK